MGFTKWLLTHGPGSVGSIAKAMANTYMRFKRANPSETKIRLLQLTLENRMDCRSIWGGSIPQDATIKETLEAATGLRDLILFVISVENQKGVEFMIQDHAAYRMTMEIIDEILIEYAPSSR
jgi:hypothetical protein